MPQHSLTKAEEAVMNHLWEHGKSTARQIRDALYGESRSHNGTVQRHLQHAEDKGLVERDRSIGVHFFEAKLSKEQYAARELENLANTLTGGSVASMLTQLVENQKLSDAEIARIRNIVNQLPDAAN